MIKQILIFAVGISIPSIGLAVPVSFNYSGTLVEVDGALIDPFFVGQPFSMTYTFASDAAETEIRPTLSIYDAIISNEITVGGYTAASSSGEIWVHNDESDSDRYFVTSSDAIGDTVNRFDPSLFFVLLNDSTETAFSSTDLPLTLVDPNDFNTYRLPLGSYGTLQFLDDRSVEANLRFRVESASVVPIPPAAILFLSGLGVLGWIRRRKIRV